MRALLIFLLFLLPAVTFARPAADRSIVVEYVGVYDGDTVVVRLPVLPPPLDRLRVRIAGIDTPELGKGAKCPAENERAVAARQFLADLLAGAHELRVYGFRWDKYGGRILGELRVPGGAVRDLLIQSGHAVPYEGIASRRDWCPT